MHVSPRTTPDAHCVICGAPIRVGTTGVLCGSMSCRWQLDRMPASHKCRVCATPLSTAQRAAGVCGNEPCRNEWLVQRPLRAMRAAHLELIEGARARRNLAVSALGFPDDERESFPLAVLPRNYARVSKLPAARRRAFETSLRAGLAEARARVAAGEGDTDSFVPADGMERTSATRQAEQQLLGAACGACRGYCCRAGGDHAFLTGVALKSQILAYPDADDDMLVARYRSYLSERTMTNGCVFQGATGCNLPRDMRAGICNRFYCDGIRALVAQYTDADPVRAFIAHQSGRQVYGGRVVEIQRAGTRTDRD